MNKEFLKFFVLLVVAIGAGPAAGSFWQWSMTPSANGDSDPSINFVEGMPPSVINDSARAMMARLAEQANDTSGLLVTTGGPTAYTVTTNQGFPNPPINGQVIGLTFNVSSGTSPTLAVDGGTAYPIGGQVAAGAPYTMMFNSTLNSWILRTVPSTAVIRGYIAGLTLSTSGPSIDFTVSPGIAASSANTAMLTLISAMSKTTVAWAAGYGSGSLDTGLIANSQWYHVFVIENAATGVVDVLVSLSPTSPVLPSGYTLFRRIGSMMTNASGQWTLFSQIGDEFLWSNPVSDINGVSIGTTSTLFPVTVPSGLQVRARMRGYVVNNSVQSGILITSPDEVIQVANSPSGNLTVANDVVASGQAWGEIAVRTNTNAQLRAVASTGGTLYYVNTFGWYDDRGKSS